MGRRLSAPQNDKGRRAMPDWVVVLILSVIEGITELLPISSTGHLLIAEHWLPRQSDLFNIVIQVSAVIAVLPLFPERLRQFIFGWGERATWIYAAKLALAFVITGIGGLVLARLDYKLPETLGPVAWAVLIGGIFFVLVELLLRKRPMRDDVTWLVACVVGAGQLVAAVFPGASRSGTTILLCLILGLSRTAATEFCFLVGIPTMIAAGGWQIVKGSAGGPAEPWHLVALGFVVSGIVSFLAVKWLLGYVRTHTFIAFGWYRIALAAALFYLLAV
jgi:undecaprenyl-diphosphatase